METMHSAVMRAHIEPFGSATATMTWVTPMISMIQPHAVKLKATRPSGPCP